MVSQLSESGDQNNRTDISACVELIGPELAKTYLSEQLSNRNLNEGRIKDYANRMERGEWKVSQPICFDEEGRLIDGQHRLGAVIRAGKHISFTVIRGLKSDARFTFDQGQRRSVAQVATIMGIQDKQLGLRYATLRAAFYGQLLTPKTKAAEKAALKVSQPLKSVSADLLINLSDKYRDGLDFCLFHPGNNQDRAVPKFACVRAVIFRAYYNENHSRLRDFLSIYYTGFSEGIDRSSAAIALRNHIIALQARSGGIVQSFNVTLDLYKKTESALRHFLQGNNVKSVVGTEYELFPLADFD